MGVGLAFPASEVKSAMRIFGFDSQATKKNPSPYWTAFCADLPDVNVVEAKKGILKEAKKNAVSEVKEAVKGDITEAVTDVVDGWKNDVQDALKKAAANLAKEKQFTPGDGVDGNFEFAGMQDPTKDFEE